MEHIDSMRVNFSPDQLKLLNICLAFLMFGVALDIRISDFKRLFQQPKVPLVGLISQLILLPILTLLLVYLLDVPVSIGLGMILLAACPGGNISNFIVHLAKGNSALSVLMTSTVSIGSIITTPLIFAIFSNFVPNAHIWTQQINLDPWQVCLTIFQIIAVPLTIGMLFNYYIPDFVNKIRKAVNILSLLLFISILVFALFGNYDNIMNFLGDIFFIVLTHNALAFALGYWFAKWNGLSLKDRKAISIETGIQNSGLGLVIAFNFFNGLGGMAIILAWWSIWHLVVGLGLATYWSKIEK